MSFIELAEKRCSIRGFKPDPIPEHLLDEVLRAGIAAPTAKNLQPFHFIVVRDSAALDELATSYPAPFFREAPAVVVICTEADKAWTRDRFDGKNFCEIDAAIAMDHMTLAAADNELGTCWIGAFNPEKVSEVLKLPEGIEPLTMMPIGYPNKEGRPKSRKMYDDLVRFDHW